MGGVVCGVWVEIQHTTRRFDGRGKRQYGLSESDVVWEVWSRVKYNTRHESLMAAGTGSLA